MKARLPILLTCAAALSALTLAPASTLHAQPPATTAARRAETVELMGNPELARVAFAEMMKSPAKKRYMARVMARDAEFRRLYAAEVGNDAPHQERNPSAHPELFGARNP